MEKQLNMAIVSTFLFFVVLVLALARVQALNGLGGYGSDIGWYFPWTPIAQVCFAGVVVSILALL